MPLIAQEVPHDDDDEGEFPTVETDSAPRFRATTPAEPPVSDPFGQSTPPPFAAETTGSAPGLRPIQGTPLGQSMTNVQPRRSAHIMWPILAVAMILVAGGALFLVWKQTQNQQVAPPVIITQEHAIEPTHDADPPQPVGPGSDRVIGDERPPHTLRPPRHFTTLDGAVASQTNALTACFREHGDGIKDKMVANVAIDRAGRTKSVQIDPPAANAAPIGACLRNVINGIPFPASSAEQKFSFDLKPKS
jgi:hypothetical protein